MRQFEKGKTMETIEGLKGAGKIIKRSTENFKGSENILYGTIRLHTYHYAFAQTHTMYHTKNKL